MIKTLLLVTSLLEAAFGIFVLVAPGLAYSLLFGGAAAPSALIMARVYGIALIGLGIACYPPGVRQGYYGMLAYGMLVALYLVIVGTAGTAGILLWPAVVVHLLLSAALIVAGRAAQAKP